MAAFSGCEENTEYDFTGACNVTCADLVSTTVPTVTGCHPGCRCKDNFVRDENNKCVPRDTCTSLKCVVDGKEWKNGDSHTNLTECQTYYCQAGTLVKQALPVDKLPACSIDDAVAAESVSVLLLPPPGHLA